MLVYTIQDVNDIFKKKILCLFFNVLISAEYRYSLRGSSDAVVCSIFTQAG